MDELELRFDVRHCQGPWGFSAFSLELKKGVTGLFGPTGCGKSWLLHLLAGHVPFEGTVICGQRATDRWNPKKALDWGLWLVPQQLTLASHLDVASNLYLGVEPLKFGLMVDRKTMRRKAEELIDFFELTLPPTDLAVGNLSGGQQRMVALLRAWVRRPRFLLLDEPMCGLGVAERLKFARLLTGLRQGGTAVLTAFHRVDDGLALAQRAYGIGADRLVFFPHPASVKELAPLWS